MASEPRAALKQIQDLTRPLRYRLIRDAEGLPIVPGKYGAIDGRELAVYSNHPRLFAKIWAIPGVRRHQTGDDEMRAIFPPEGLEQVAGVSRPGGTARRRPRPTSRGLCDPPTERLPGRRSPAGAWGRQSGRVGTVVAPRGRPGRQAPAAAQGSGDA
jgi:hypothetical protein